MCIQLLYNPKKLVLKIKKSCTEQLQSLTIREGYSIDLITPSKETYVPKEYIEFIKTNYERGNISYKNMKNSLEFIGLAPEQFGYEYPQEEDY
ncbi:MAG: hypothetical protein NUV45_08750 [Tepidanaerobacteraceae bacterium]|nr:hypothetical protein [Tepidanaerobacteraceae bacterium]